MRRAARRLPVRALMAAAGLGAVFAAADAAWGQAAPAGANLSSHAAGFFEGLLAGRVWVLERPNSARADDRGRVWAHYHAPDGTLLACAHLGGSYAATSHQSGRSGRRRPHAAIAASTSSSRPSV